MKLWSKKNTSTSQMVESFTVGRDRDFDSLLASYDILGSIAHVMMLGSVGIISKEAEAAIVKELKNIYPTTTGGSFIIDEGVEDVHSQVEFLLTKELGDSGKMIHAARSRNDQVLLDIKLYLRHEMEEITAEVFHLFQLLIEESNKYKDILLPGYTHLQLAMPSSFGLWFGAYAESLVDDITLLRAAYQVINKNPLGSAAGYGSSFPINRSLTTRLLGFEDLNHNVVYAQMGRGKAERVTAMAMANIADTLSRMAMDACLYVNQNFDFISFNSELTTGSSIMPHKKNPDVLELIRAHCNRIKALPNEIMMMTTNLPSGYHRDLQLLKEHLFPAIQHLKDCLRMMYLMVSNISVRPDILKDEKYQYLFSVEAVNELVNKGMPFRDAYKQVGEKIESGEFSFNSKLNHTHEGSLGNLCNDKIEAKMKAELDAFHFENVRLAIDELLRS
ncbi:MAG: argininosuccinate lyase [Bacteroidetes bacterium]|nr:argininosuccinate lyase [Bacteroidota bacterium]